MPRRQLVWRCATILGCVAAFLGNTASQQRAEEPETVMITFHAKPGQEAELERVIARHWTTARRMGLVRDMPHVTLRGTEESDKEYFVDIFTWRDGSIPDAAPGEIRQIWAEMNQLVEARGGHPGLEFKPVACVAH